MSPRELGIEQSINPWVIPYVILPFIFKVEHSGKLVGGEIWSRRQITPLHPTPGSVTLHCQGKPELIGNAQAYMPVDPEHWP